MSTGMSYLNELKDHELVFVRSTIQFEWVLNTNIAVWPEFLTERTWKEDAVNPLCCICGGSNSMPNIILVAISIKFKL